MAAPSSAAELSESANSSSLGTVLWLTGLSSTGKTSVALRVRDALLSRGVLPVLLDGDRLRAAAPFRGGHSVEDRRSYANFYSRLAAEFAGQGHFVVCATISLFHDTHAWNRANLPRYLEVLLRAPLAELQRRDTRGVYRQGSTNIVGVDLMPEFPVNPDLTIDNHGATTPRVATELVMQALEGKAYL
ncbi:adenylyl-sulfate kinase [Streptomyces sp. 4N509B]|uniref:adenylyl-sulfate kinase n=1 Tax=Streptomyces sp. 4N509B TaxID=3457413 RepID=UPI003FD3EE4B